MQLHRLARVWPGVAVLTVLDGYAKGKEGSDGEGKEAGVAAVYGDESFDREGDLSKLAAVGANH